MNEHSPFDNEEAQQAERAELPADDLKDDANRAEVAQSSRRDSQAQRSNPSEHPVEEDEAQHADEVASLPVQEVEDEDAARLAAHPAEGDSDAQRADEVASLPIQEVEDDDKAQRSSEEANLSAQNLDDDALANLTAQPIPEDDEAQRAETSNLSQSLQEEWRVAEAQSRLSAQPVPEDDEPQRADNAADLPEPDPEDDWRIEKAQAALPTEEEDALRDATRLYDRDSVSDLAGSTLEERAEIADELDRVDRFQLHHAVEVYILRGIESAETGRRAESFSTEYNRGNDGFREFVDEIYTEQKEKVELDKFAHQELHNALKDALAEQEVKVAGSARQIMEQLKAQRVTEIQLLDTLEKAYNKVFADCPGLISDDKQAEILKHIDEVRETLRHIGPGRMYP